MGIIERRKQEKIERRDRILAAAEKFFDLKGYAATTMADIGNEVELSPSTLYLYYPNKEVLYAAVSLKIMNRMLENIENHGRNENRSPYQKIIDLKEVFYSIYETHLSILLNVFRFQSSPQIRNLTPEIIEDIVDLTTPAVRSMARVFEQGMDQGYFKSRNPAALVDIFWGVFSGLIIFEESKNALNPKRKFMKETLDLAFEILIEGLKRREGDAAK